eukprot:1065596-Amphidinium_carterae.2
MEFVLAGFGAEPITAGCRSMTACLLVCVCFAVSVLAVSKLQANNGMHANQTCSGHCHISRAPSR